MWPTESSTTVQVFPSPEEQPLMLHTKRDENGETSKTAREIDSSNTLKTNSPTTNYLPLAPVAVPKQGLKHRQWATCETSSEWQEEMRAVVCKDAEEQSPPLFLVVATLLQNAAQFMLGYAYFFFTSIGLFKSELVMFAENNRPDFTPLYDRFIVVYNEFIYGRLIDTFNRPIVSAPGARVSCANRVPSLGRRRSLKAVGPPIRCVNMGSYNYLGFAKPSGPCVKRSVASVFQRGISYCSARAQVGTTSDHRELESLVAEFVGTEDAVTFPMGFATNSTNIATLTMSSRSRDSNRCLVLSDSLNHASLIMGCKLSGATIRPFKHNDMYDLEKKLRNSIVQGHDPRLRRPWSKIIIMVEGVYSMEGSICNLPRLIELKRQYRAYLFIDEAHSIGAVGPNGGGVCDLFGVDPEEVDIHMGTFTKSFASVGGYIAGRRELIEHVRRHSPAHLYGAAMPAAVCEQIVASTKIIMDREDSPGARGEGPWRVRRLARNTRYFRAALKTLGCIMTGSDYSPVVPWIVCSSSAGLAVSRELLRRGVASVAVGYPAVPLLRYRMRFCVSASHTTAMLDKVVREIREVAQLLGPGYLRTTSPEPHVTDAYTQRVKHL